MRLSTMTGPAAPIGWRADEGWKGRESIGAAGRCHRRGSPHACWWRAYSDSGSCTSTGARAASSHRAIRGKVVIDLTVKEYRLLEYLMKHAGQVVTRTMLLENVWDYHFDPQTNVIDVHISRLRSKVDKGFATPLIHTVRGVGYSLSDQPQDLPEVV